MQENMNSISNKKRIFIVSPTESEMTNRGKRHPNLANHLYLCGYDVTYISSTYNHGDRTLFNSKEIRDSQERTLYKSIYFNIGGYFKNVSLKRMAWNLRIARKSYYFLEKEMKEGDALIVPSRLPELVYYASKLKIKKRIKVLLDIRDVWPDAFDSIVKDGSVVRRLQKTLFTWHCNFFLKRSVAKYDKYVYAMPFFLSWLTRFAPKAKPTFIPLGFDEKRWDKCIKKNLDKDTNKLISLVYCGSLTYGLDVMPILRALRKRTRKFTMTFIGDNGKGEKFHEIQEYILSNCLPNVSILGRLPAEQVVAELGRHDMTIIPIISGGLPNKVWDSVAACTPMLSLGNGDSSKFVLEHDLGWVADFDEKSVEDILDNITHADIVAKSGNIARIRDDYSHSVLLKHYERLISELIS
jgi:hypothetical protein